MKHILTMTFLFVFITTVTPLVGSDLAGYKKMAQATIDQIKAGSVSDFRH